MQNNKSKSPEKKKEIPKKWAWIENLVDEARLPELGLPKQWPHTEKKHQDILYNPTNNHALDLNTGKERKYKKSLIGFITSTKNNNPMPGTNQPAAGRFNLYEHEKDFEVQDAFGHKLVPCLIHGDYVAVESLEADHAFPKALILKRQKDLIEKMNNDEKFAKCIMGLEGMDKFFVKEKMEGDKTEKYYGTLFFYEIYFNDIDNLWLICGACNKNKSDKDTVDWLSNQWAFGDEFKDYISEQMEKDNKSIMEKTKHKEGLAEVAMTWFWENHTNYISTAKKFFEEIKTPIQLLNLEVDHYRGEGKYKAAERKQASLDFRLEIANKIINETEGLEIPGPKDKKGTKFVHDSKGKILHPTVPQYEKVAKKVEEKMPEIVENVFSENLEKVLREKREKPDSSSESKSKRHKPN